MRKLGKRGENRDGKVGKVGRPKKYGSGYVRVSLRLEKGLAGRLKLLHLYDQGRLKSGNSKVSRDVWIQSILLGYVESRDVDVRMILETFKGELGFVREDV